MGEGIEGQTPEKRYLHYWSSLCLHLTSRFPLPTAQNSPGTFCAARCCHHGMAKILRGLLPHSHTLIHLHVWQPTFKTTLKSTVFHCPLSQPLNNNGCHASECIYVCHCGGITQFQLASLGARLSGCTLSLTWPPPTSAHSFAGQTVAADITALAGKWSHLLRMDFRLWDTSHLLP